MGDNVKDILNLLKNIPIDSRYIEVLSNIKDQIKNLVKSDYQDRSTDIVNKAIDESLQKNLHDFSNLDSLPSSRAYPDVGTVIVKDYLDKVVNQAIENMDSQGLLNKEDNTDPIGDVLKGDPTEDAENPTEDAENPTEDTENPTEDTEDTSDSNDDDDKNGGFVNDDNGGSGLGRNPRADILNKIDDLITKAAIIHR